MFASNARQLPGEHQPRLDHAFEANSADIDVCKALFVFAQRCQAQYLNARGIELLFDVSGGEMPAGAYRQLELLIQSMLADIAQGPAPRTGGDVSLTVRRHGGMWIVGIEERGGSANEACVQRRSVLAHGLAQELNGTSRVEARHSNGCVTGFMIPASVGEPFVEAATH